MPLTPAEHQMILDLRKEINELKRERTRLRTGIVTDITGPVVKVQMGGECGGTEIEVIANGPVAEGDNVTLLEGGGGAVITGQALQGGESGFDPGPGITIDGKQVAVDASVARKNLDAQLIGVGNPTEWNHGANKNYVDALAALTQGFIPEHGSLPSSPFNGQTILYGGLILRYDSSAPFPTYPWMVISGSFRDTAINLRTISATSYANVPTDPIQIALPAGMRGIMDVKIGGEVAGGGSSQIFGGFRHSYSWTGGGGASHDWSNHAYHGQDGTFIVNMHREDRHVFNTAGTGPITVTEQALRMIPTGGSDDPSLSRRYLEVKPIFVRINT